VPELPEVETNARNLARYARGRRIVKVTPPPATRELGGLSRRSFAARLTGHRVEEVTRRGKWILCRLDGGHGLGLHLGMTGKIARVDAGDEAPRFTRASFELDDGHRVCFVDSRRFGKLLAARWDELAARDEIARVGKDALHELTVDDLAAILGATGRTVKEVIMDQARLAGVGNLYATEALWRARIHPATPAKSIPRRRIAKLHQGIREALEHGLATYAGEGVPEYIEEGGENPFFVYDRAGERCPRCKKATIEARTLGGRTSAFCPRCQPAPA
jgi:formamidopyrimidine-DNA glycosylase